MKILLFTFVCASFYIGMVWLTTKNQESQKAAIRTVVQGSLIGVCILWPSIFISMFWAIFVAVLVLVVAVYFGSQHGNKGHLIKHGVFGSLWITLPLYIWLLPNT